MKGTYDTQWARDLHWALTSPMLLEHPLVVPPRWGISEAARYQGLLGKLDRRRSALAKAIRNAEVGGLGHYFEVLFRTWLEQVPPAQVVAANWQVYAGSHTIGEFDLLFLRDAVLWHWELAIKFYLGHPAPDGQFRWYGINPDDRLDRKWAKMRGQQLRLASHPAGRGALQVLGMDEEPTPQAMIKGYLFVPQNPKFEVVWPIDVNDQALCGWWVHRRELSEFPPAIAADDDVEWIILDNEQWLAPARPRPGQRQMSWRALKDVVSQGRATMVAGLRDGTEVSRGVVAADGWPQNL